MEELNLQALEQEYRGLKVTVAELKGRESAAESTLETAREVAVTADNAYQTVKSQYEKIKGIYEANIKSITKEDGTYEMPISTYDNVKAQVEALETQMKTAEQEKQEKDRAVEEAQETFSRIQGEAQQASERMDLILTSFGANEKINSALVNELENTYFDKIEKSVSKKEELDSLKTTISNDEELRKLLFGDKDAGLDGLEDVLRQYKELTEQGPSKEVTEINKKAMKLYASINSRLKKLGLKGVTISNAEIDMMLTEKDDQGRIVVPEIDRRIAAEDTNIEILEAERDSIIEVMGITLEMAKDPVNGTPELQSLLAEVNKLQSIVDAAQKDYDESKEALGKIEQQKAELTAKVEKLRAENPDYEEILKLQEELANAGNTGSVSNPEYVRLKNEIDELTQKMNDTTKVDNPDYAPQKAKVDAAEAALEAEKRNMTPTVEEPGDEIVSNVEYRMAKDAVEYAEGNYETYRNAHPEIADLYDIIVNAEENKRESEEHLAECESNEDKAFNKLTKNYVSKTVYTDLNNPESASSKALEAYRAAELAVREAMQAYQNQPTEENRAKLETCINAYNEQAEAFKISLQQSVEGKGELPSTEAIHNYLLHVLNKERPTDKAYNIKNAENRLALLERQYNKTSKSDLVAGLKTSSGNLDEILPMLLSGKVKLEGTVYTAAMSAHAAAMEKFGDEKDNVISTLNGTGPVVNPKDLKWWQKIFNRMPREKVAYDFKAIKKPEAYSEWEEAKKATAAAKQDVETDDKTLADATKDLSEDQIAQIDSMRGFENALIKAENALDVTPKEINKSKIERLKAILEKEQAALAKIPAQKDAIDKTGLGERLAKLKERIKDVPEFTGDSKEIEAKKTRLAELKGKNPGVDEISEAETSIQEILTQEKEQKQKNSDAEVVLSEKRPILLRKLSRVSLLQKIKDRFKGMTDFIKIKDAGKMSDNRSPIARTLAEDTKSRAEVDAERD